MLRDAQSFIRKQVQEIQSRVGEGRAVCACSGGVDSTTCAVLAHQALGENLTAVFIDTGLMREGEPKQVVGTLRELSLKVELVQAADRFFAALDGVTDHIQQRLIFREVFYQVFRGKLEDLGATYLVQGTIEADRKEAAKGQRQHNVGIEGFGLEVVEPLRGLYKNEVRVVARALGLPREFSERMPFPGPGLLLRVSGEVTPERVELVRKATTIVEEEALALRPITIDPETLEPRKDTTQPFQALAILLRDQAMGVTETEERGFGNIIVVRVVDSIDALTATPTHIPREVRARLVDRLTGLGGVTRVLFDETPKPPATIEWQ